MRKYLATLHTKPAHHKKQFALIVSGGFTFFIFVIWLLATFGEGGVLAQNAGKNEIKRAHEEVSPLEYLRAGVAESLDSIKETVEFLNKYGR